MTNAAYQQLGSVAELIPDAGHTGFQYEEFATVTKLLGDGSGDRNYVLQSTAPTVRRASYSWIAVAEADKDTIRGYAESKVEQTFVTEDGTSRSVVVMDFDGRRGKGDLWTVSANLLETSAPVPPGS